MKLFGWWRTLALGIALGAHLVQLESDFRDLTQLGVLWVPPLTTLLVIGVYLATRLSILGGRPQ